MKLQTKSADKNRLLILYHLTYFIYGLQWTTIAPLIPYLAESSNFRSDFIFLVSIRGATYIIGGLAEKYLYNNIQPHIKLSVSLFVLSVTFYLASLTFEPLIWAILCALFSLAACEIQILGITLTLKISKLQDRSFWSSSIFSILNFGGIIGPILIAYFSVQQLKIVALLSFACSLAFVYEIFRGKKQQPTPQQRRLVQTQNLQPKEDNNNLKGIPIPIKYYYFGVFLLYSSFTMTYRVLIPSYAVMIGVMPKQDAALIMSFFYVFLTVILVISMYIQIHAIKFLNNINLCNIVITVFWIIGHYANQDYLMILLTALAFSISFSAFYPLLFAVPRHFGVQASQQDIALFVIAFNLGESVIVAMVGQAMSFFRPQYLFWSMLLFGFLMKYFCDTSIRLMSQKTPDKNPQQEQVAQLRYSVAKSIASNYD